MEGTVPNRGYLREEFRLFHLDTANPGAVDWHCHSFHKIFLLLEGKAVYRVEGRSYTLEPGDIVLVPMGCIHRPEVTGAYERIIVYVSEAFLRDHSSDHTDLEACFRQAAQGQCFALRPAGRIEGLLKPLRRMEGETDAFGSDLLRPMLLMEFLVELTRDMNAGWLREVSAAASDQRIQAVLQYINLHPTEVCAIDALAQRFFVSKYYLMRTFRAQTGCTIHEYWTEKRLLLARERLAAGEPAWKVSEACGFGDYSSFSRAYKKRFSVSPAGQRRRTVEFWAPEGE